MIVAAFATNAGYTLETPANGAALDTVTTTATVGSTLEMVDQCSSVVGISVALASYAHGSCTFEFGSSNDPSTTLRMSSSAGDFMSGGGLLADRAAGCGALTGDTVGIKVSAVTGSGANATGCATSAAATNGDLTPVADGPASLCSASATGTTHTCTVTIGINESGADLPSGSYVGTLNLDIIG